MEFLVCTCSNWQRSLGRGIHAAGEGGLVAVGTESIQMQTRYTGVELEKDSPVGRGWLDYSKNQPRVKIGVGVVAGATQFLEPRPVDDSLILQLSGEEDKCLSTTEYGMSLDAWMNHHHSECWAQTTEKPA